MSTYTTQQIRTIALVGHGAGGKTTLAEAMLHRTGTIATPGSVEKGTTVADFDPLEKTYQHSLNSSLLHFSHLDTHIHLIDTPGYPNFMGPAISALDAVETVAVVINAQNGIELTTHRMMTLAQKRHLCRMIVINKIDADNVDLPALLLEIQEASRQGMPADQSPFERRQGSDRLFFQSVRRCGFFIGSRGALRARRSGGGSR